MAKDERNLLDLFHSFALLGDSPWALVVSFVMLVASIYVSLLLNDSDGNGGWSKHENAAADRPFSNYESLGPIPYMDRGPPRIHQVGVGVGTSKQNPADDPTQLLFRPTAEMRTELEREGVVCVRGLISEPLLARLDAETAQLVDEQRRKNHGRGQRRGTQFHTVAHSSLFRRDLTQQQTSRDELANFAPSALMEVALWSPVPAFAASFLLNSSLDCTAGSSDTNDANVDTEITCRTSGNNHNTTADADAEERLRVIRDIFLAKDDDAYVCGWHVDDMGFWPATPESPGINAWIALDDMEQVEETGGFALAVQSHTAPWRDEAYYWTGAPATAQYFPTGGYANASAFFAQRTGRGTCHLREAAPHLHRRMEETARIFPMQRGDVIFHTRWLFHRTVAVNKTAPSTSHTTTGGAESKVYRRYSIRYGPGSASIVPPGYGTELSVLWNESNGGLSVDEICETDGPWYPQAWPALENRSRFGKDLSLLVAEKIPVAEERRERRKQEMRPYLKRIAKQNHQFSTYGQ